MYQPGAGRLAFPAALQRQRNRAGHKFRRRGKCGRNAERPAGRGYFVSILLPMLEFVPDPVVACAGLTTHFAPFDLAAVRQSFKRTNLQFNAPLGVLMQY